ncbi:MAG: choice-of-anchor J domain-containing protein [Bacteroidota bacterium]
MKKSLLIITLLGAGFFGFSQNMLLEEYFNDPVNLPATWTAVDQDGDGSNWYIDTYEAEIYAVSRSYDGEPLSPENYLISPQISLTGLAGTVKLRYTIQVADEEYFAEHYKVAVSTTGNAVGDFTNIVFEETCTADDYYEVPPYWHERIVDLTPFMGQSIYLTFCHYNCTDMYKFLLDSIQVYNLDNVGVNKQDLINLMVYPNPVSDKVYVNGAFDNARISLFTADGRLVYVTEDQSRQTFINVSKFERGMYLLQLETSKGVVSRKLAITG